LDLAEKIEEAVPLHKALKELYEELNDALENDPPQKFEGNYGTWLEQRSSNGS